MLKTMKNFKEKTVSAIKRFSRVISIFLMVALIAGGVLFAGNNFRVVSISENGNVNKYYTLKNNVDSILGNAGFGDNYDVTGTTENGNRLYIEVTPNFNVYVTVGEETFSANTIKCTVAEALEKCNVTVNEKDMVTPALDTLLTSETYIDVVKYVEPPKPEPKPEVRPAVMASGSYTGGTLNGKATVSTLVPTINIEFDENGIPLNYTHSTRVQATAYTYTGFRCSTGVNPQPGYIAVNPKVIPYGTKMYIVSADGRYNYGYAVAADTGGFIKTRPTNVDLFMTTEAACRTFGRRDVIIYFLSE